MKKSINIQSKRFVTLITVVMIFTVSFSQVKPYRPGEKASYAVRYGFVNGGIASFELKSDTFKGQDVLHSYFIAYTTGVADVLYSMRDIYESYMDTVTDMPLYAIRNVKEGHYKRYNPVTFDRTTRKDSAILTSNLTGKHVTTKEIHDILSCFYSFRKNWLAKDYNFKKGDVVTINTWFCDEFYPIKLAYKGKESIRTKAGKIKAIKFNPVTEVGRVFKTNEDVSIWFSDDKNYLPVKVRFDIFVGAFSVELLTYEGLVAPLAIEEE